MRTVFFVVLDGLGDEPIPDLGDRTPLEAAETPHLDGLAARGSLGSCTTVGEGIAPESDIAVMALLGYDPAEAHPGRGVVEALGAGVDFQDGDLAWRCNFATVEDWPDLADRRAGRDVSSEEAASLARAISEKVSLADADFVFRATTAHRAVLRIRSKLGPLGAEIDNTDPAYERRGALGVARESFEVRIQEARALDEDDEAAVRGAQLTNEFTRKSHEILADAEVNTRRREEGKLEANVILCRDAGNRLPEIEPIEERYGATFGCFVEMPVEAGIAAMTGMRQVPADEPGDDLDEQYARWAAIASKSASDHDVLYIHIKGPDIPAHDGRWQDKLEVIEAIDRSFFGNLERDTDDSILLVTADHATSCLRAAHTDAPVPVLLTGPGVGDDGTTEFSEREASLGDLGHKKGTDLMPLVVDLAKA